MVKSALLICIYCTVFSTHCIAAPYNYYQSKAPELLGRLEKQQLSQGIDKIRKGQFEYAWSDLAYLLHYFPNHPKALAYLGDISIQIEKPERAIQYFERALKLYPFEGDTSAVYGVFLHKTKQLNHAIVQYENALALDPDSAEYNYNLGLAYLEKKDYPKASQYAEYAYSKGYPLPGLKYKLQALGAWKDKKPIG